MDIVTFIVLESFRNSDSFVLLLGFVGTGSFKHWIVFITYMYEHTVAELKMQCKAEFVGRNKRFLLLSFSKDLAV